MFQLHAPRRRDFVSLLKELDKAGFKWGSGSSALEGRYLWTLYKQRTVITIHGGTFSIGKLNKSTVRYRAGMGVLI